MIPKAESKATTQEIVEVLFEAYEVQHLLTIKKAKENKDPLAGYKIILTSVETQRMFNSATPLYGTFTASNIVEDTSELEQR